MNKRNIRKIFASTNVTNRNRSIFTHSIKTPFVKHNILTIRLCIIYKLPNTITLLTVRKITRLVNNRKRIIIQILIRRARRKHHFFNKRVAHFLQTTCIHITIYCFKSIFSPNIIDTKVDNIRKRT
ncbi:hypothetical protein Hanom_Chr14g01249911 [Helianthus anomalus]